MNKKLSILLMVSTFAISSQAFAVSNQSQKTLNAFRKYEPEFNNSLRSLEALEKKLANIKDDDNLTKTSEIWLRAETIMGNVEDRYDAMENLLQITMRRNPGDQIELQEGFNKLEDAYQKVRDFYTEKYTYSGELEKENDTEAEKYSGKYGDSPYQVDSLGAYDDKILLAKDQDREKEPLDITGSFKLELRNADEKHQAIGMGGTVPNDYNSGRLMLAYEINENKQITLEEKYLTRERNEKIKENHLTLSFFKKSGDNSAMTVRDKLQHVWYTDDATKNYRTNLLEGIYTKSWNGHERVSNFGIKSKVYPRNSRSDYNEYIIGDQETWYKKNSTIFTEFKSEFSRYKNADNLNYNNVNIYAELNKSYTGNKAEMKVANTYDRRVYSNESIVAYRTSYYDDFFQFDYELPVNDKVTYNFEGEYTKRNYGSDAPRGYSELNAFNGVTVKADDRTFVTGDYRYIYNDENTRSSAHKNNILHAGWTRNINKDYKVKFDETYHNRSSVSNRALDFYENTLSADLSWRIKKDYKLSWNTEHFIRRYDNISLGVADYRYLESGADFSYSKRKAYDWRISQRWRNMGYKNWGGVATGWTNHILPITELKYNRWLTNDLKFAVKATWEKTYYREFNNDSQELEYNFGDPVFNKEITASLEYKF